MHQQSGTRAQSHAALLPAWCVAVGWVRSGFTSHAMAASAGTACSRTNPDPKQKRSRTQLLGVRLHGIAGLLVEA